MTDDARTRSIRHAYDAVSQPYCSQFRNELDHKPLDRALLDVFADRVRGHGVVADVGTGPGHVAHALSTRGVDAMGIDLSPGMIATARTLFPNTRFEVGDMRALPYENGAFAGLTAFYSIVHVSDDELPIVAREFRRVLAPGGLLLMGWHVGHEEVRLEEFFGKPVELLFRWFTMDAVRRALEGAGFTVEAEITRKAYKEEHPTVRGYMLASAGS